MLVCLTQGGIVSPSLSTLDGGYLPAFGALEDGIPSAFGAWDVSSGVLLVKEAGGRVTEPQGNNWSIESKDILVSNTLIHEKLLENLTLL